MLRESHARSEQQPPNQIPQLGLGTHALGEFRQVTETVKMAIEIGYRHIDTAQRYRNEAGVGDGIDCADVPRDDLFIASKIWHDRLSYHDVKLAGHETLDRLGIDHLDLLYVHWPINTYDPESTLAAFMDLHTAGYVKNIGVSNFTTSLLAEAQDYLDIPIAANQIEMHPLLKQESIRAYCERHDIAVVAYSPLAKGDVFAVPELTKIADKHDTTEAQVSLAWLREKNVIPIPKASSPQHLRDNWESLQLSLDPEDIAIIDAIDREKRYVDIPDSPF